MKREWFTQFAGRTRRELALGLIAESAPDPLPGPDELAGRRSAAVRLTNLPSPSLTEPRVAEAWERGRALEASWPRRRSYPGDQEGCGVTLLVPRARVRGADASADWWNAIASLVVPEIADSLVVERKASAPASWSWPLRVGVVSRDGGLGPARELLTHDWHGVLFKIVRPDRAAGRLDLLVIEGQGLEAMARLEALRTTASALILVGEPLASLDAELKALALAGDLARCSLVARQPRVQVLPWLEVLIEELSHARPIDHALFDVARRFDTLPPLILGDRAQLPALEVKHVVERALRGWAKAKPPAHDEVISVSRRLQDDLGLDAAVGPKVLATAVTGSLDGLGFDRERKGATTLGLAMGALDSWKRSAARRSVEGERVFRARLRRGHEDVRVGPLRPGGHAVEASIGQLSASWLSLDRPFPTPELPPDDPEKGWSLRIWAWEPTCLQHPVMKELWLPARGETETVSFDIDVPARPPERFGARVTVVHGNRVLQTGLLSIAGDGEVLWEVDAAPVPTLAGLNRDRWVDASIVLNDDVLGQGRAFLQQGDIVGDLDLPQTVFDEFKTAVSDGLEAIADDPELFTSLRSEAMVKLLQRLAETGKKMHRAIVRGTDVEESRLNAASRIQIVQARALTFLPAEFLYRHPAPLANATLCAGAESALRNGGVCSVVHDETTVCPSGFWSLEKVIERHAHAKRNGLPSPYRIEARSGTTGAARLDPLRNVLFAASDLADESDPAVSSGIERAVKAAASRSTRVSTWGDWKAQVQAEDRSLLLAVPHHDAQDRLFIGASSSLTPAQITRPYVDPRDSAHPIVMLIGCKTLVTRRLFDDLVQAFAWEGARVVVTTYATVLGRHVGPAVTRVLEVLDERLDKGPVRLGDVLLAIRRELLLEGKPMALGLTAYGDADVLLARDQP